MKTWIMTSGVAEPPTVGPVKTASLTNPTPLVVSDCESEVRASDKELPFPISMMVGVQGKAVG